MGCNFWIIRSRVVYGVPVPEVGCSNVHKNDASIHLKSPRLKNYAFMLSVFVELFEKWRKKLKKFFFLCDKIIVLSL